jgi:hypothetical protein
MISRSRMDKLTGALMLDRVFRESFLSDRISAIRNYNVSYAQRFKERPIDLNDEELALVLSLPADSIESFVAALEQAISDRGLSLLPARYVRQRYSA